MELGYDYCLKEECQQRCVRRVELAAVHVNKAADYYQRADEVLPPRQPVPAPVVIDDAGSLDAPPGPAPKPRGTPPAPSRPKTTLERLRLRRPPWTRPWSSASHDSAGGEITAREMDRERDRLIEAFNRQVTQREHPLPVNAAPPSQPGSTRAPAGAAPPWPAQSQDGVTAGPGVRRTVAPAPQGPGSGHVAFLAVGGRAGGGPGGR